MISLCLLTAQNAKLTAENEKLTELPHHEATWGMYMVWMHALKRKSTWFEETFKQSIVAAYGKCPTSLNPYTLKEFVDTSDPKSYEDWIEMISRWSALLHLHYPEHDEKFSALSQAFIKKHHKNTEALKAREAQARETEKCQPDTIRERNEKYWERKRLSDGLHGLAKPTHHTTGTTISGFI